MSVDLHKLLLFPDASTSVSLESWPESLLAIDGTFYYKTYRMSGIKQFLHCHVLIKSSKLLWSMLPAHCFLDGTPR